ncbi:MAG: right-handed parallel beta-helix repeat-containing protein [Chloroflexaceae bacterium]|nr:right-handed parallel beta-helix repeat-containing protein [Chloroflexaceae bacterium]
MFLSTLRLFPIALSLLLVLVSCASPLPPTNRLSFYVAPNGNDSWSGRLAGANWLGSDGPFASLEKARDAIRAQQASGGLPPGGAVVYMRGGVYQQLQPVVLEAQDSGQPERPITYMAFPGEEVRLTGAVSLDGSAFTNTLPPEVSARLSDAARVNVVQLDLRASGVEASAPILPRRWDAAPPPAWNELIINDELQQLARWPNLRPLTGTATDRELWRFIGELPDGEEGQRFSYRQGDERPARWRNTDNIWFHGFTFANWADYHLPIAAIDPNAGTIALDTSNVGNWRGLRSGYRYVIYNVLEELDQPGEYYIDQASQTLYLWPPADVRQADLRLTLNEGPLINVQNASHLSFEHLIMEGSRGDGISISGASNLALRGNTIRNMGRTGVVIRESTNVTVADSTIHHVHAGVDVNGGDQRQLRESGNRLHNNVISHFGRLVKAYAPGVWLRGVGVELTNNELHDGPHSAILFEGALHRIERNVIHRVAMETEDVGAIYSGRRWSRVGTVIRHNYIYNTFFSQALGLGPASVGVYLDDGMAGTTVEGNIFDNVGIGVFSKGPLNRIEHNLFLNNRQERATPERLGVVFIGNTPEEHLATLLDDLQQFDYTQPPWSERFPELVYFVQRFGLQRGNLSLVPYGLSVQGNRFYNNTVNLSIWPRYLEEPYPGEFRMIVQDNQTLPALPDLIDPQTRQLRPNFDFAALNMPAIPLAEIGPMR